MTARCAPSSKPTPPSQEAPNSYAVMKNGNSLDAEIENPLSSPNMAGSFPTGSRTLAKSDTDGVQNHFADIASKVRVE